MNNSPQSDQSETPQTAPSTQTSAIEQVALVGHCGFDSGSLRSLAQKTWPAARVLMINQQSELDDLRSPATLLLVNRELDGRFNAGSGVELIRQCAQGTDAPKTMLISNYDDAQQQAQEAGALPGFGKNQIGQAELIERLRHQTT